MLVSTKPPLALLAVIAPHTFAFPFGSNSNLEIIGDWIKDSLTHNDNAAILVVSEIESAMTDPLAASNKEGETWACDIRAWTRAPDLSPGIAIPAQARLAVNGSSCGDIMKWEVGLRYKERAIMKRKAEGVELPKKPMRPVWNESRFFDERNDMWSPYGGHWSDIEIEYETAMDEWSKAMMNESLWIVKGQERVVFDISKELEWTTVDGEVDVVRDFAIHVPNTNFPPVMRYDMPPSMGIDEQMINTETLSDHYHLVHLANGTVIGIPSGLSGFVPLNSPVASPCGESLGSASSHREGFIQDEMAWPIVVEFDPMNRTKTTGENEDDWIYEMREVPDCDKDFESLFTLTVSSNVTRPTLGQNITLDMTLTRIGNGTQIPAHLDVSHGIKRNMTWAYDFVSSRKEYDELTSRPEEEAYGRWDHGSYRAMMLVTPDETTLEEKRKRQERREGYEEVEGGIAVSGRLTRLEPYGDKRARYEVWKDVPRSSERMDEWRDKTEWTFSLEIPLMYNDLPSFEKTFETLRSTLDFTLHTAFTCNARKASPSADSSESAGESTSSIWGSRPIDEEWRPWRLPLRPRPRANTTTAGSFNIALAERLYESPSFIFLDARVPYTASTNVQVLHYSDERALGPILADNMTSRVAFQPLSLHRREEGKDELRKSRYKYESIHARRGDGCCGCSLGCSWSRQECRGFNAGGGRYHAGQMWQRKEEMEKQRAEKSLVDQGQEDLGFVVQA